MPDLLSVAIVISTFLLAGVVKGVIGLGLPTISLALLAATFDLTTAMVLLIVPSLVTNLWQAATGGHFQLLTARLWPFLLSAFVTIWIGSLLLTRVNLALLSTFLGCLLVFYALTSFSRFRLVSRQACEPWTGTLMGLVNGLLTGMTGSFVVPGIMYLQSIGLDRNQLVQAMGILFSLSTIALAIALQGHRLIADQFAYLSLVAVLPALAGMWLGRKLRHRMTEERFRRFFYSAVLFLGIIIIFRSLTAW